MANETNKTLIGHLSSGQTSQCKLDEIDTIIIIGYALVFIVGVSGNAIVLLVFGCGRLRSRVLYVLISYLAFFDGLSSFINPLLFIYWSVTCNKSWHFGVLGCKLLPALGRIFTDVSIGIILIMAIDRCVAIVFPMKARLKTRSVHFLLLCLFTLSIIFESYYIVTLHVDANGACAVADIRDLWYSYPLVITISIRDVVFIVVFITTTVLVYRRLQKSERKQLLSNDKNMQRKNNKVMKMLIVMAIVSAVTVIPRDILHLSYVLSHMVTGFVNKGIQFSHSLLVTNKVLKLLQISNGIYNVFIYGKMYGTFRRTMKMFFCRHLYRREQNSGKNHSQTYQLDAIRLRESLSRV